MLFLSFLLSQNQSSNHKVNRNIVFCALKLKEAHNAEQQHNEKTKMCYGALQASQAVIQNLNGNIFVTATTQNERGALEGKTHNLLECAAKQGAPLFLMPLVAPPVLLIRGTYDCVVE